MKFVQTFLLALCVVSTSADTRTRFKSVKCVLLNSTVAKIRYCDLKPYTRTFVAFNVGVTHLIPLTKPIEVSCCDFCTWKISIFFKVKGSSKYRYGLIYRDVINIDFDLCSIKDGNPNLVAKVFNAVLKDSFSGLFKKCPYPAVSEMFIHVFCPQ